MSLPDGIPPTPVVLWRPRPAALVGITPTTSPPAYFGGVLKSESEITADLGPNARVWVVDDLTPSDWPGPVYPGYHTPVFEGDALVMATIEPIPGWNEGCDTVLDCAVSPTDDFTVVVRTRPIAFANGGSWTRALATVGADTGNGCWLILDPSALTFRCRLSTAGLPVYLTPTVSYALEPGVLYTIVAVCDSTAGELRLRLYSAAGALLASTTSAFGGAIAPYYDGGVALSTTVQPAWRVAYNADGNQSAGQKLSVLALYDRALADAEADAFAVWSPRAGALWGGEVYASSELIYPIRHIPHAQLVGPMVGTALRSGYVAGQQHGRLLLTYDDGGDWKDGTMVPRPPETPSGDLTAALAELGLVQGQVRVPHGATHVVAVLGLMVAARGLATAHVKIKATAGAAVDEGADFSAEVDPQWDVVQRQSGRAIEDRTGETFLDVQGGKAPPIVVGAELELDNVDTASSSRTVKIEVPVYAIDSVTSGFATIRVLWAQVFWEVRPS